MGSERHSLHTPHCPCALSHVSSEERKGTEWGCSPPSIPGAPSPRRQQDGQRHHHSLIRGSNYRLRPWETSPRDVPEQQRWVTFLSIGQSQAVHH